MSQRKAQGQPKRKPRDRLVMPNDFPARERAFITQLASDLHLYVTWDEYDDEDQNLVVFRLPNYLEEQNGGGAGTEKNGNDGDVGSDDEDENWVDEESEEEDEEANEAVDRVLNKYEKADVVEDEEEDFDTRHERNVQEKMDEWKRGYYRVSSLAISRELTLNIFSGKIGNIV